MDERTTEAPGSRRAAGLARRLGVIGIELAILAAAWYLLKISPQLVGAIAGVVVLAGVVPARWQAMVGGIGFLGIAALVYFSYGNQMLAGVLGVFSLVELGRGVADLRAGGGPTSGPRSAGVRATERSIGGGGSAPDRRD